MKRVLCILLCAVIMMLSGCAAKDPDEKWKESVTALPNDRTYSVLFIGNSYTYSNNLPHDYFLPIAQEAGYDIKVAEITKGAHKLYEFADPNDQYGQIVEQYLAKPDQYDYVILQEQSVLPAGENAALFYEGVRRMAEKVRNSGAQPVLFATWGRKTGSETLDKYGWTNESMTWRLAAAYEAIGEELDIPVVHVGQAFLDINQNHTGINPYSLDLTHPSKSGTYLAAMCLFAGIFRVNPTTLSFTGSLPEENAAILRAAARTAVLEPAPIPEEYKTKTK